MRSRPRGCKPYPITHASPRPEPTGPSLPCPRPPPRPSPSGPILEHITDDASWLKPRGVLTVGRPPRAG
eukprot:gene720-36_t